jgi:formylglycine-generating enzyme required for sulfatase activity
LVDTTGLRSRDDSDVDARADGPSDADPDTDAADATPGQDGSSGDCPGTAGPKGVRVGSYCIDATEVTGAQYNLFLAAAATGGAPTQPSFCAWNTSFEPCVEGANKPPELPATCIDWCDAWAFCAWAGKRLCGRIGGGSAPFTSTQSPTVDQWYAACSASGTRAYPYGSTFDAQRCQGRERAGGGRNFVRPGSLATCEGGIPGLFDMSGNAGEWVDACQTQTGQNDICAWRGGSVDVSGVNLACAGDGSIMRGERFGDVGFRCCSAEP